MGEREAYFKAHGKELIEKEDLGQEGINNTRKKERKAQAQLNELALETG